MLSVASCTAGCVVGSSESRGDGRGPSRDSSDGRADGLADTGGDVSVDTTSRDLPGVDSSRDATRSEAALDGYKPLVEKLRAHAQALSLQLTPASVNAVKAQSGEARTMAQEWYKRHQEIDSTVDRFLKENAPAVAAEES